LTPPIPSTGKPPRKIVRQPEYEFRSLMLPRTVSRNEARALLTEQAEYGHWELDRLRLFPDGRRKITLKRRIIRQVRSPLSSYLET
jgi:hypothetical protein